MIFGFKKQQEKQETSPEETQPETEKNWLSRLKDGLSKTSGQLGTGITDIFNKRKPDAETIEAFEELLIQADIGVAAATKITNAFAEKRHEKELSPEEIKRLFASEITPILEPVAKPMAIHSEHTPYTILVVGVNGNGKTTTIGKLAQQWKEEGKTVMLCAADTFRAAAVEQLQLWGKRTGCEVITGATEADPASVVYQAMEQARTQQADILLIDTAGRLHNKANLMAELEKITKVTKKLDDSAPHSVIQVLDATTGQNAISQVEMFEKTVHVTGLIVTKLDGTAKAGIVVALAEKFGLPVHAIGVGEGAEDLQNFEAQAFANNLVGL